MIHNNLQRYKKYVTNNNVEKFFQDLVVEEGLNKVSGADQIATHS